MVRARSRPAARVAVRAVHAFVDVAVGALPETCDAVEVAAEVRWRAVYEAPAAEVVAPWIRWRATRARWGWWRRWRRRWGCGRNGGRGEGRRHWRLFGRG